MLGDSPIDIAPGGKVVLALEAKKKGKAFCLIILRHLVKKSIHPHISPIGMSPSPRCSTPDHL